MAEFKVVISDPKSGKSIQKEVKETDAAPFIGLKIGDTVKGDSIGFSGYEFAITGGSDHAGFPMRSDVAGSQRKKILAVSGIGIDNKKKYRKKSKKGLRTMDGMRGNTIHEKTAQVNLKVLKLGKEDLFASAPEVPKDASNEAPKKAASAAEKKK